MNKISKSVFGVASAIVAIAGAALPLAEVSAYGDNSTNGRTAYTMKSIEKASLGTAAVFNSITDNSAFGNEFNFVGARTEDATSTEPDEITIEDGKTYIIRLYYHNDNANSTATNVKARFSIPTTVGKSLTVMGYLTADNSNPTEYWDHVVFKSDSNFYLEYVEGSAVLQNNGIGATNGGAALSDSVITDGVLVGYDKLDGKVPGCYQYDGSVLVKVVAKKVDYTVEKTVRIAGTNDEFTESVDAKVGDKVEFQIHFKNNSGSKATDVTLTDVLPSNLKYVGNTTITNSKYTNQALDTAITSGVHIGNYKSGSEAYVYFTAEVTGTVDCEKSLTRTNTVTLTVGANDNYTATDTANVVVKGETCTTKKEDDKKEEKSEGETTEEIVNTGAGEIVSGVLGAGSITTALGYYIASRKKLM